MFVKNQLKNKNTNIQSVNFLGSYANGGFAT